MSKIIDSAFIVVLLSALLYFAGYVFTDAYYSEIGLHISLISVSADEVMMMGTVPLLISVFIVWLPIPTIYFLGIPLYKWLSARSGKRTAIDVAADKWLVHSMACLVFIIASVGFLRYCEKIGKDSAKSYLESCKSNIYTIIPADRMESSFAGCLLRYSQDIYWLKLQGKGAEVVGIAKSSVNRIVISGNLSAEKK
jgi:hypothetical protein